MTAEPGKPPADALPLESALRVCSFESRKGAEIQSLLERHNLQAIVAPSMREIPIAENTNALEFGDRLLRGAIDVMIFLTGVGARALDEVLCSRWTHDEVVAALLRSTVVVRGPKPAAVMREWGVRIDVVVPEPNTWRDLLMAVEQSMSLSGKTVAIQEYGVPNAELARGLESLGGNVVTVPVYRWALPVDTAPLRAAVRATIAGEVDVLMFTSAQQFHHVLMIADEEGGRDAWLAAARRCVVASIGPTATETLTAGGLAPDIEPEHPKMGHLVLAAAREAREILRAKREGSAQRPKI